MEPVKFGSKLLLLGLLITGLVISLKSPAQEVPTQWEAQPGLAVHEIISNKGGKIISTDALPWPDGRSALILYIKTKTEVFRCVDWKQSDFQDSGFMCFKLIKPKK